MNAKALFQTSETWMALVGIGGQILKSVGILPAEIVDQSVIPIVVYILGRISGKAARATIK